MNDKLLTKLTINYSQNFLKLVKKNTKKDESLSNEFKVALSVWAFGETDEYRNYLKKFFKISFVNLDSVDFKSEFIVSRIVAFRNFFFKEKEKRILIYNDAKIFHELTDGDNIQPLRFSRKHLREKENYLILFDLINAAALEADGWFDFRNVYRSKLNDVLSNNKFLKEISFSIGKYIVTKLVNKNDQKIVFVDTGLQGTFALYLAECVRIFLPSVETDVNLFCIYPWLSKLFKDRYFSTQTAMLYRIEQYRDDYAYARKK